MKTKKNIRTCETCKKRIDTKETPNRVSVHYHNGSETKLVKWYHAKCFD